MSVYEKLRRRSAVLQSMTGQNIDGFEQLYEHIAPSLETYEDQQLRKRDRRRDIGQTVTTAMIVGIGC